MSEIKHEWRGTTLIITSDSGTSACDLKGEKGDTGVRGAQGVAGIVTDENGELQLGGYVTKEDLENLINANISFSETVALDFTNFNNGSFKETLASGEEYTHTVVFADDFSISSIGGIALKGVNIYG